MKKEHLPSGLLLFLVWVALGCIPAKEYRPVAVLTPLKVSPEPDASVLTSIAKGNNMALPVGAQCLSGPGTTPAKLTPAQDVVAGVYSDSGPCIAFVEYNKKGVPYNAKEDQIGSAAALVQKAIQEDPQGQPIIVGFVHGWKHSADPGDAGKRRVNDNLTSSAVSKWPPEDSNIQGFEHVLNYLYRCYYADPNINSDCLLQQRKDLRGTGVQGHVVVGIYFAWYGSDISPFWPLAQQLSVYSRGREADKVAAAQQLSKDLLRLSEIAHPLPKRGKPKPPHEPMFVLVGHSYGARLLEQAAYLPLKKRIQDQLDDPEKPTFADLVLYVNSAGPAINGMDMLNLLGSKKVVYRPKGSGSEGDRPLLAAITTPADAPTGIFFTAANSPISWNHTGTVKLKGFDPKTGNSFDIQQDEATLWRNTLGHLQQFQSHSVTPDPTKSKATCFGGMAGTFYYWVPGHCFYVTDATPIPGHGTYRWNGTPYWVMSTDGLIIPDHGTIFTDRFLRFVGRILPPERDKAIVTVWQPVNPDAKAAF